MCGFYLKCLRFVRIEEYEIETVWLLKMMIVIVTKLLKHDHNAIFLGIKKNVDKPPSLDSV